MKAVNSGATDNCDDLAVPLPNVEDDPLHLHLKIEVTDGLLDESGRAYIVALNGIIAHSGHKNQQHRGICLPQLLRSLHAVHHRHPDIHEHQIINRFIFLQKCDRLREVREAECLPCFLSIPVKAFRKIFNGLLLIFHNCHIDHSLHLHIAKIFCLSDNKSIAQ